ncbi:MAG TPA: inositol monophosphatase family protein [Phycisphaerales bacterium]|nr:inositol monophosphatase family protein [Phycisphaerales bacterium]
MDERELTDRSALMLQAAARAGELSLAFYQRDSLSVDWKSNATEVTEADRQGERLIRDMIEAAFPDDAVVGEEHGSREGRSGWTWWIDPIDGTRSFAHGVPLYSVLIGLQHLDRSVAGVIELPALAERVYATQGRGAWWERRDAGDALVRSAARVSDCDRLDRALMCTTSFDYYKKSGRTATLERLNEAVGSVRGWSDAYLFALAATGRIDLAIDPVMNPWDNGPFPTIFREAGGVFTSWSGEERIDGGDGVAANPALHAQALRLLDGPGGRGVT